MYNIATIQQRESSDSRWIAAVQNEMEPESEETEIAALRAGKTGKEPYQRQVQTNSGQWKAIKETGLVHAKIPTALSNTAFSVNLEDTGKNNACSESKKTNCKEKQGCA